MLVEEFMRAGIGVDFKRRRFVDVQNIFHKMEQRTLVAAYKFYCDKDLTNAHSAEADTLATYEVLKAQRWTATTTWKTTSISWPNSPRATSRPTTPDAFS